MSYPETSPKPDAAPSARTAAYYMGWIGELAELYRAGMLNDEDFSYQRAERLEQLLDTPRRPRLWIRLGVPLAGLAGVVAWWFTADLLMLEGAGVMVVLCVLGHLGRTARVRKNHLTVKERSDILYDLLGEDLITSDEFLNFDERLTGRTQR